MTDYPAVKVYALGAFEAKIGSERLVPAEWKSKKALKLFKYLLVNYGQACSSDQLVDKLWPYCTLQVGKQRLYDTVYQLRRELDRKAQAKSCLQTDPQGYRLDLGTNYWFDWQQLADIYHRYKEAAVEELSQEQIAVGVKELQSAISLYKGPFMGQNLYEDWLETARVRYRQMLLDSILAVSKFLCQKGQTEEALYYLKEGIRKEPFREDFYLEALQLLKRENRVWEQAILYKKYTRVLENELGISPSPALQREFNELKKTNLFTGGEAAQDSALNLDHELEVLRSETELPGAMECEFKTFKEIYKLRQRQASRTGEPSTLLRISFEQIFDQNRLNSYLAEIKSKLRAVDVVTSCCSHLLVLLPGAPLESNFIIGQRILGSVSLQEIGSNPQIKWEEISVPAEAEEKSATEELLTAQEPNNQ